jgi:hypothetical protein
MRDILTFSADFSKKGTWYNFLTRFQLEEVRRTSCLVIPNGQRLRGKRALLMPSGVNYLRD